MTSTPWPTNPPEPAVHSSAVVSGWCDERFGAVRDAFEENFAARGEVGAAVSVLVDGVAVLDLQGGWADEAGARPWAADTLVNHYSAGKPFVALLALQLVDAGHLGLDDPIAAVWPEFGVGTKADATLRQALCHQAGVPALDATLRDDDLWSWDRMVTALAATDGWWVPGTRHGYHTNTYGFLLGEVVRRVTGELPGDRLRTIAGGVGADVWCGLPDAEHARCADVIWALGDVSGHFDAAGLEGDALMEAMSYFNPPGLSSIGVVNTAAWRRAQVPSTNGHSTATGIARLYGALLEPGRLLSPELLAEATRAQSTGWCPMLHEDVSFGLGFQPSTPRRPFGSPSSFGHFGTGGAVGFADPEAGVAFGYVMNHVIPRWQSTRNRALIDALYASL
jgi:CubicO group peptidase (beta-lactamase class C family)